MHYVCKITFKLCLKANISLRGLQTEEKEHRLQNQIYIWLLAQYLASCITLEKLILWTAVFSSAKWEYTILPRIIVRLKCDNLCKHQKCLAYIVSA